MRHIVLPDVLTWEAGTEWGLMALATLVDEEPIACDVRAVGPRLEAVATAVHQLGLDETVRFTDNPHVERETLFLIPRVYPSGAGVEGWLGAGNVVVSSDTAVAFEHPNLHRFPRRDVSALLEELRAARQGMEGAG